MRQIDSDLERALREGPPDEPMDARPLVLPTSPTLPLARGRLRPRRDAGHPRLGGVGVVAIGAIAALALAIGAISSGTRLGIAGPAASSPAASSPTASSAAALTPSASGEAVAWSSPRPVAPGLTIRVPAGWQVVGLAALGNAEPFVALANFDLDARCRGAASLGACIAGLPLSPGEILVTVANDDTPMTVAQVASPSGVDASIDGMPAVLQAVEEASGTPVRGVAAQPGCDAHRSWWIGRPSSPTGWLDVEACSAFADRSLFRAAVDGVARSVVFGG